ncbi:lytic transglycosylase domain-containing protein [Chitinophaga costaii]|nr:lytic transglycosylase domain-containing protein [Chitinophaga costaii]
MRKLLLLLLTAGLATGGAQAAKVAGDVMPAFASVAAVDTAITARKIVLPKDSVVHPSAATALMVRREAASLPSSIRSPKVYEQINNNLVSGYINDFANHYSQHLQIMIEKGQPYFAMVEKVFRDNGVPEEMKYLAVIESSFNTNARSKVGAVGAWQFMSGTARLFGLTVAKKKDERKDFYKSTVAAAKFLNELHNQFDDWLLVVAAYNCGAGGVQRAIKASGRSDFWGMQYFLPSESRNHVYKFIATGYILDRFNTFFGVGNDAVDVSDAAVASSAEAVAGTPLSDEELMNTVVFNVSGKYRLDAIAKGLDVSMGDLERLNPNFARTLAGADNAADLRLPKDKMTQFMHQKNEILKESVQLALDDKAVAVDKSRFPAPVKVPVVDSAAVKKSSLRAAHNSKYAGTRYKKGAYTRSATSHSTTVKKKVSTTKRS